MTPVLITEAVIARIAAGVVARTLPKAEWNHEAHFAAALWLLRNAPGFDGPRDMPGLIRAYNEATNTPNTDTGGYHHSITLASLAAAADALAAAGPDAPLPKIMAKLLSGRHGHPDWLLDHWSRPRLFSVAARRQWVPPDLKPLP